MNTATKTDKTGTFYLSYLIEPVEKLIGTSGKKVLLILLIECQRYPEISMKIHTTRFATIEIEPDDILFFRNGLLGFEDCRHWVLLADVENSAVAWLQSMQHADIALPVVSPRRFVNEYQVRLEPSDVDVLQLASVEQAYVLGVVSRDEEILTLNLRAPLVINLDRRIGCQVVTVDPQPMQYELATLPVSLRRSA